VVDGTGDALIGKKAKALICKKADAVVGGKLSWRKVQ